MNSIEKIQRNSNDVFIIVTEEEEHFRKKFKETNTDRKCTMCGKIIIEFHSHPELRVIVCSDCFQFYDNTVFITNRDGTDQNCRWCAKVCSKYSCSECTVVFCSDCLNRNFGANYVDKYVKNTTEWKCLICNQKQLWALRAQCANANNSETDDEFDILKSLESVSKEVINTPIQQNEKNIMSSQETENIMSSQETEITLQIDVSSKSPPLSISNKTELMKMRLTSELCKEATAMFESTKVKFQRLIDKLITESNMFAEIVSNKKLSTVDEVHDLNEKISCVCSKLHECVDWIDSCNKESYQHWLKKNVMGNPSTSKLPQQTSDKDTPPNTCAHNRNSIRSDSRLSDKSVDLLTAFQFASNTIQPVLVTDHSQLQKTDATPETDAAPISDPLNSSQETDINEALQSDNSCDNPEISDKDKKIRKNKTKKLFQALRLKKAKTESETSGVSDNFMIFLDQVKADLSLNKSGTSDKNTLDKNASDKNIPTVKNDETTYIKTESIHLKQSQNTIKTEPVNTNTSIHSNKTVEFVSSPHPDILKKEHFDTKTVSFTQNGIVELQDRIRTDFEDIEETSVKIATVQYLCDKTGDLFDGYEMCSSEDQNPTVTVFNNERDSSETEDEYVNYDFSKDGYLINNNDHIEETHAFATELEKNDSTSIIVTAPPVPEDYVPEITSKELAPEYELISNHGDDRTSNHEIEEIVNSKNDAVTNDVNEDKMSASNVSSLSQSEEDTELLNALEKEKELIYENLLDSNCSDYSSSSGSSVFSTPGEKFKEEILDETRGYIKNLDIANELDKLRTAFACKREPSSPDSGKSSKSSSDADEAKTPEEDSKPEEEETTKTDQKLLQICKVSVLRMDFDNTKGIKKYSSFSTRYRINDVNSNASDGGDEYSEDDDEKEINKLLNLDTLNKRKHSASSDSTSDHSKSDRKKLRKKHQFTSKATCDTTDSSESDIFAGNSPDALSIVSDSDLTTKIAQNDKHDWNFDFSDSDINLSTMSSSSSSNSSKSKHDKSKLKSTKKDVNVNKKIEEIPVWKKDSLLTGRLTSNNSDKKPKTSSGVIDEELLKEEERKFLEKPDVEPKILTLTITDNDDDSDSKIEIVIDSEKSDTDSDVQIISKNKRQNSNSDDNGGPHKKGRRNIKKVLQDSELQEETQIADLEEEQRKERIQMKNKSLDAVLSQSSLSQEDIGLVLDLDEITKTPLVKVPQVLVTPLKPHQISGIKFMWDVCFESVSQMNKTSGTGCILAHCMGLGKTMQVVVLTHALLTHRATNVKHVLVICPLSTVFNWRSEYTETLKNATEKINIFDIRLDLHRSFKDRVFQVKKWRRMGGVLIMGYDSFTVLVNDEKLLQVSDQYRKDVIEALVDPGPDILVCDEGHILKSGKTKKFNALNRVKTKRRIILTGTPLQNNLIEYWFMVSFVKPHLLGTYKEYTNRFVNPIVNGQYEDSSPSDIQLMKKRSHVLHKKLQTTVHRYELSELKQYLPNKYEYVLFVQLSALQIKLYELYLKKIESTSKGHKLFQNFHDLQNIWTHPALLQHKYEKRKTYEEDFDPNLDPDTVCTEKFLGENWFKDHCPNDLSTNLSYGSKFVILFSIIRESSAIDEKILVFSSSLPELDLIEQFLKNNAVDNNQSWIKNTDYYRMDGSVAPEQRMRYCNSFNDTKNTRARLFLISHKVGGLGLNLVAANRVVLMDVNWNPAYDTQSVFRVYRFGQTKECHIYRLVSLGTMEELVYSRAVTKLAISCRVVDEQQIQRHFKEDDQHKLYKLNTDYLNQEPVIPNVPADRILAKLWGLHKPVLYNFKDHQSMLENLVHEELNEEEMMIAWEEFHNEEEQQKLLRIENENAKDLYKQMMQQHQIMPMSFMMTQDAQNMQTMQQQYGPTTKYTMVPSSLNNSFPAGNSLLNIQNPINPNSRPVGQVPDAAPPISCLNALSNRTAQFIRAVQVPRTATQIPRANTQITRTALQFPRPTLQFPRPALKIPQPGLQVPHSALQVPYPALKVPQPALKVPRPAHNASQIPRTAPQVAHSSTPIVLPPGQIARPVGLIRAIDMKPNPFHTTTHQNKQTIVPDIISNVKNSNSNIKNQENHIPVSTNYNFTNLPSTSGLSKQQQQHRNKQIYGNPNEILLKKEFILRKELTNNQEVNKTSNKTYSNNGPSRKMPKLLPVNHHIDQNKSDNQVFEQLARNGVNIVASPKQRDSRNNSNTESSSKNANYDDIITLE